jgi:hypothetical protein
LGAKRVELFNKLLSAIAKQLRFKYNAVELSQVYFPTGHSQIEKDQEIIRLGLAACFQGKFALPMEVRSFPFSQEASDKQTAANDALVRIADRICKTTITGAKKL